MKKIVLIALIGLVNLGFGQNLLTNLQGCYPLDCDDAVNGAPTGNILNGFAQSVICTTGHKQIPATAYQFAGNSGSYVWLPGSPPLLKPTNAITVSGWYRPSSTTNAITNNQYLVFTKNTCSQNFEAYFLAIYFDGANAHFMAGLNGSSCTGATAIDNTNIVPNQWYHVVFYIDNSTIEIYVDGVLTASTTHSTPFNYHSQGAVILGGSNESFDLPYFGQIDNVRFYDRQLSVSEISDLFLHDPDCSSIASPTLCVDSVELIADYDAAIGWNGTPGDAGASTNYGNALQNAGYMVPAPGGFNINRALLHFDFSSLPTTANVISAKLSLFAFGQVASYPGHVFSVPAGNDCFIHRVDESPANSWTEMGVTFNNQPQLATPNPFDQLLIPSPPSAMSDLIDFDILSIVQNILAVVAPNLNNGMMLYLQNEAATNIQIYCSEDHPNPQRHPRLKLKYTYPCPPEGFKNSNPATGILESKNDSELSIVYPNPNSGSFTIENAGNLFFKITDITGREIDFVKTQFENKTEISLIGAKTGFYILNTYSKEGKIVGCKKISVQ